LDSALTNEVVYTRHITLFITYETVISHYLVRTNSTEDSVLASLTCGRP